ncbi:type VII secretion protein EccB [Mycobacterium koreense]|uniref:Type VII secretion protein EccB n=1 Tax=Mycolicibacillus koreensis TaxID=1069220 RepID=A0A7I7SGB2_9MYCO|nr:type VII secretion protein EccB [Mycolicibacillus koreensis]MCV7247078.1 type VII secretion protein EccB [Mycolicibacillus koreensis]ODR09898.1 type VII secretion protein EccB [Mycolicibacillus koreensis]OSC31895.1 type VII secretion protein EccB [Mycolicibacillus koreensis]BBY55972.1 ESX-3 secretion system protein eccB3 [Mycolicibacillus koreensis]
MSTNLGQQDRPRRGFKSKSPVLGTNTEPDTSAQKGWGSVTRHQISGWRFQIRRLSNGVALQDTRMLADPLRRQSRSLTVSVLIAVVLLAGAFVLSIIKPAGAGGNRPLLADRSTNALYVVVNDQLHPVLNLASARLILGKAAEPTTVKPAEIDSFTLGNTLGIPGAPSRIVQSPDRDARWLVCDAVSGPESGTTVIAGDPVPGPGHATSMPDSHALLATANGGKNTWLIWDNKRARIDLSDTAVASAVGINLDTPTPRRIDRQLLNLIPESEPLGVPFLANAGDPPRFVWPSTKPAPPIGSVVVDHEGDRLRHYAVTAEGLQAIPSVVAAMLRSSNAYGLVEPPELTPDEVAKAPAVRPIPVEDYPSSPLTVIDPVTEPVTCGQWVKLDGAPTSSLTLSVGQRLPLSADTAPVTLVGAGPTTATRVALPQGSGYFVQVTGQHPQSKTAESLFWVSDLGVRYGIADDAEQPGKNAAALGMTANPVPAPWAVVSLFQAGPTLSKDDALVAH